MFTKCYTFLDSIDNMIGHEGNIKELDDWVEDKISHAHALLQDLHRYFAYGRGYDSKNFLSQHKITTTLKRRSGSKLSLGTFLVVWK